MSARIPPTPGNTLAYVDANRRTGQVDLTARASDPLCRVPSRSAALRHCAADRPLRGWGSAQGSGCVAEPSDEVLVEAEVFCGGFHGESAVELFADAEVELA
jgi:hypothetical protein